MVHTKKFLLLCTIIFLFPVSSFAVAVNEIAWMGTGSSAYCEWIELYNDGAEQINLNGWTLVLGLSTPKTIPFAETYMIIPANGYFVVGRSTESCDAVLNPFSNYRTSFGNGLTDTGFSITLQNESGVTVYTLSQNAIAWDSFKQQNTTRQSLQWSGSAWMLADKTPQQSNSTQTQTDQSSSSTSPVLPTTSSNPKESIVSLSIIAPSLAYKDVPVAITSVTSPKTSRLFKSHFWNFGDLTISELTAPTHTYTHTGTYMIRLTVEDIEGRITAQKEITVVDPLLTLERTKTGDVTITNNGTSAIDIHNFKLSGERMVIIPQDSIILSGKTITVPRPRINPGNKDFPVILFTPSGTMLAALENDLQGEPVVLKIETTIEKIKQNIIAKIPVQTMPVKEPETVTLSQEQTPESTSSPTEDKNEQSSLPSYITFATLLAMAIGASVIRSRAQ